MELRFGKHDRAQFTPAGVLKLPLPAGAEGAACDYLEGLAAKPWRLQVDPLIHTKQAARFSVPTSHGDSNRWMAGKTASP